MNVPVHIVHAFTQQGKGGNPAALVLNADHLTNAQKQQIAAAAGLSETAFISTSDEADFKLDFFTPTRQIAHCGHATIASFAYLKRIGSLATSVTQSSKQTIDGRRDIKFVGSEVYMQQTAPVFTTPTDEAAILASLGLRPDSYRPMLVNTGNTFVIVEVEDPLILSELNPDFEQIRTLSLAYQAIGYYVFCRTHTADATTRMFAPAYGIPEESATGMAAGPLAAFLYTYYEKKSHYKIEQGRYMNPPSPSLIKVDLHLASGVIQSLFAGGEATLVRQQMIEI